jgi:hypothetical protein
MISFDNQEKGGKSYAPCNNDRGCEPGRWPIDVAHHVIDVAGIHGYDRNSGRIYRLRDQKHRKKQFGQLIAIKAT